MRIDNPQTEDIKIDDMLYFKPLRFKGPFGYRLPFPEIAYIEREDTLEVGDEISWTIIAEFTAKVIAFAAGHVMYQWHDGQVNMEPLSYFQHHSFKITKKAGAQ